MKRFLLTLVVLSLTSLIVGSCGSRANGGKQASLGAPATGSKLSSPKLIGVGTVGRGAAPSGKNVSGLPQGIRVTWSRNTEAVCVGYYLYRDTQQIPDSRWGDATLRVNGGNLVSQPASGTSVSFDDTQFAPPGPPVGSTWYYRVTAVDDLAQESDFSNELGYTVQPHHVDSFDPPSAYWSDTVTITGYYFGFFGAPTDSVEFQSIFGGTVKANVLSWTPTSIQVVVPNLAATGRIEVIIAGSIAYSPTDCVNLQPFILDNAPQAQFRGGSIHITGGNFGASQGNGKVYFSQNAYAAGYYSWADGAVDAIVPGPAVQGEVWLIDDQGHQSNHTTFIARPRILTPVVMTAGIGETVVVTGVGFGLDRTVGEIRVGGARANEIKFWADNCIGFVIPVMAKDGNVTVKVKDGLSNSIIVTVQPPLTVKMTGLASRGTYAPPDHLLVTAVADRSAERADLVVDGRLYNTIYSPHTFTFDLDPALFTNAMHFADVRVYRRAQEAWSDDVLFFVRSLPGDVNGDDVVNDADAAALGYFLKTFGVGRQYPDADYSGAIDGNGDGVIDEREFETIARNFGKRRGQ